MIRYALACDEGHAFERWFAKSATYDRQVKARARQLSGLQFDQGREGNHGAAGDENEKARRGACVRADARGTGSVATVGI